MLFEECSYCKNPSAFTVEEHRNVTPPWWFAELKQCNNCGRQYAVIRHWPSEKRERALLYAPLELNPVYGPLDIYWKNELGYEKGE